jgi:hypothetical protein
LQDWDALTTITSSESSADSIQAAMSNSSLWVRMKIENMTAIFLIYHQKLWSPHQRRISQKIQR